MKLVEEIFQDKENLAKDEQLKEVLFEKNEKEHIVFSCKVHKQNRWDMRKNVILTISNFGQVSIISEEKHVHWIIKLADLKSLTWVTDDKDKNRHEIVINHKTSYDYRIDCMSMEEKDNAFKSLKYMFWLMNGVNLPIYSVPMSISIQVENTKRAANKAEKRNELPEKYRAVEEDIYFEDPLKSQLYLQQQKVE